MILFCDTSALVKRYIDEPGSEQIALWTSSSNALAISRITWVEMMSAFARRNREQPQAGSVLAKARQEFSDDWQHFMIVEVTAAIAELAGDYAEAFALRAYDSLQLATAHLLKERCGEAVSFACFDRRLLKAASALGIESP